MSCVATVMKSVPVTRGVCVVMRTAPFLGYARPMKTSSMVGLAGTVLALGAWGGGCGGGGEKKSVKPNTPPVQQVVAVSRKNPGLAKCKKVSYGLFDNTPETPQEPLKILAITCDGATVGLWENYRT